MNVRVIASLLLMGIAFSGHADEAITLKPSAATHNSTVAESLDAGRKTTKAVAVQFGTNVTEAVMVDVSARVADDLEARMTRALEVQQVPAVKRHHADPLIVSRH
tara:strand:- start:7562 stop:7876 length:315 start_codon:yes stop_codon:yes gene_type:complete